MDGKTILFVFLILYASGVYSQVTNPRPWAEWEETDGIIIHQPNYYVEDNPSTIETRIAEEWDRLYVDLIQGLFEEGVNIYYILDTNDRPGYHSGILDTMHIKYDIDTANPLFHVVYACKSDYSRLTKWTRDNGPMNVYKNETDSLYLFLFNDDNKGAGGVIRDYLGLPDTVFNHPLSGNSGSDGGNYMVDGNSMAIINCGTDATLPDVKELFGLETVHCLPDYLYHIDYYMKIIDEETLIIATHTPDDYTYGSEPYSYEEDSVILHNMLTYIQENVVSQYGRPMNVHKIHSPPSMDDDSLQLWYYTHYASYTNSLIVNNSVFVPQYDLPSYDSNAINIYKSVMPGYNIVPVYSRRGLSEGGAVHCLTNSVASREAVLIKHAWYQDSIDREDHYLVEAEIKSKSGISNASVCYAYRADGPFFTMNMVNSSGNSYSCNIPDAEDEPTIYYYITAVSNSGKSATKPIVAPHSTYRINITEGNQSLPQRLQFIGGRIHVYPNPADEELQIDFSSGSFDENGNLAILFYDIYGKVCLRKSIRPKEGYCRFNLSNLRAGTYFIIISDEGGNFVSEKLMVR